jgi:adenine-specific DNA-methyltransferase
VMCDEIFDRDNFVGLVTVEVATTASYRSINVCPVNVSEYILIYAKDKQRLDLQPVYVKTDYSEDYSHYIKNFGDDHEAWELVNLNEIIYELQGVKSWREFKKKFGDGWKQTRFDLKSQFALQNREQVVSLNTLQKPSKKVEEVTQRSRREPGKVLAYERGDDQAPIYMFNGRTLAFYAGKVRELEGELVPTEVLTNVWTDISFLSLGLEGDVDFPNGKKPEALLRRIMQLAAAQESDLVLDYHLGSGTTAAVAHKMGRPYIGIEQLDYGDDDSIVRLKNVIQGDQSAISKSEGWTGGGEFVACELMEWNASFMERVHAAQAREELESLWESIQARGFLSYKVEVDEFDKHAKEFSGLSLADQKRFLLEVLDKNHLYVNLSEIEDQEYGVSEEDKRLNRQFYGQV